MSVWEFIGWAIAVPLSLLSGLFVIAFLVAVAKLSARNRSRIANKTHPSGKHLRAVD